MKLTLTPMAQMTGDVSFGQTNARRASTTRPVRRHTSIREDECENERHVQTCRLNFYPRVKKKKQVGTRM